MEVGDFGSVALRLQQLDRFNLFEFGNFQRAILQQRVLFNRKRHLAQRVFEIRGDQIHTRLVLVDYSLVANEFLASFFELFFCLFAFGLFFFESLSAYV